MYRESLALIISDDVKLSIRYLQVVMIPESAAHQLHHSRGYSRVLHMRLPATGAVRRNHSNLPYRGCTKAFFSRSGEMILRTIAVNPDLEARPEVRRLLFPSEDILLMAVDSDGPANQC